MAGKVLRVFLNVDLRCAHDGLTQIAKKEGVSPHQLQDGEYLIFINSEKNRLKLYAKNEIIAYLRLPKGKIDLRTIALIPEAFQAKGKIAYDETLKTLLEKHLSRNTLRS